MQYHEYGVYSANMLCHRAKDFLSILPPYQMPAFPPTYPLAAHLPLEEDELASMQDLLGQTFDDIARLFLSDSIKRLDALTAAAQVADFVSLQKISHTLCGSAGSIGATALSRHCNRLETDLRQGQTQQVAAHLYVIRQEFQRIETKLRGMLASA